MAVDLPSIPRAEVLGLALAGAFAAGAALYVYRKWRRSRVNPLEVERLRRGALAADGKISDASLVELREQHLFYAYEVRGVEYIASQDISSLRDYLPRNLSENGVVAIKYDPRNPANSIVVAEEWSGLRAMDNPKRPPAT